MRVGQRIKRQRLLKGITQEELANKLNVNIRTVGNWEIGKNKMDVERLAEVAQLLDITVSELLDVEPPANEDEMEIIRHLRRKPELLPVIRKLLDLD
jgi:transcriptional regulator with XRE-family HTH domain